MKMLHAPRVEYPKGLPVQVNEYIPGDQVVGILRNRRKHLYTSPLNSLFYVRNGKVVDEILPAGHTPAQWASIYAEALGITLTKIDVSEDHNYQYARVNLDQMVAAVVGGTYQYLYFPISERRVLDMLRYTGKTLLLPPERFVILPAASSDEANLVVRRSAITSVQERDDRRTITVGGHGFSVPLELNELVDRLGGAADINIPE